jgi:hypothetical protein
VLFLTDAQIPHRRCLLLPESQCVSGGGVRWSLPCDFHGIT